MEETMVSTQAAAPLLPPGFRFHPTDEELILHYLRNRAASVPCPVPIIADVDIYKFDPWDLPCKAVYGDGEWYFFSPRDRKYPNGIRPNRAAGSGYWKATGTDKPIHDSATGESVGVKKALVFYKGRPPKGTKTSWIMHEYRLAAGDPLAAAAAYRPPVKFRNASMRLDDWVLCRIYRKSDQASPTAPPIAEYDSHLLDHDELSSGGLYVDDICSSFYGPTSGGGTTPSFGTMNATTHHHQQQDTPARHPTIASFPEFFDDYSLAHMFDSAVPSDGDQQHAAFAMHPSLNQLLAVGDSAQYSSESSDLIYSSDYPGAAGVAKRKVMMSQQLDDDCVVDAGNPPAKKLHVSYFDAPQTATGGVLSATSSHSQVLSGLTNHNNMLPQF